MCSICDGKTTGTMPELRVKGEAPMDAVFSGLSTGTYDQIADYLTDGYWNWSGGGPRKWNIAPGGTVTFNVTALTTEAQDLARKAFEFWSDVANITFSETTGTADITFDDESSGAYASSSVDANDFITSSTINVDKNWFSGYKTFDSYTFQTYIHEIGHALGLGHAGSYNGSASFPGDAVFANDSWQGSIMSYFSQNDNPNIDASDAFVVTPMMADIIAIQNLYGAATSTRDGNTVYGNNSNAGSIYDADTYSSGTGSYWGLSFTIYDTGGTDTLDYTGFAGDQVLDLRAEGISSVMGWTGNVIIARGVVIENAKGGSGNDTITGNDASNRLIGMDGDDTIDGGAGADVLEGREGNDTLMGGRGFDELRGAQGDDVLFGGWGNDTLYGGAGTDVAGFTYNYSEYTITENGDGSITVAHTGGTGQDGTDRLYDIELLRFNDRQISLDPIEGPFDVVFLQDLTGSFYDDLPFMQAAVDDVAQSIKDDFAGSRFAITSFKDTSDSYTYRVESDFTTSVAALASTYAGFSASGGGDTPEAQLTALAQAAAGTGLSYASGNTRLFILSTDAGYHNYEDIAALRSTFEANDIIPIFTVTRSYVATYEALVEQLGRGVVVEIQGNSSDFADGIRFSISQLSGEVTDSGSSSSEIFDGTDAYDGIFSLGGDDTINGNAGDDLLDGGSGDDTINGGDGNDDIRGGSGSDTLNGDLGSDELSGGSDDDSLFGGRGFDELSGGDGNDRLYGAKGKDTLRGGNGDDFLEGGAQADNLFGNAGNDTASYASSSAGVQVNLLNGTASGGDAQGDRLGSIENLIGSNFADTLSGDANDNALSGLGGADRLNGFGGNDRLDGGGGDDIINGGGGNDQILGRAGADTIDGGDGDDAIDAGADNDVVNAGSGDDDVFGGDGLDRLFGNDGNDILRGNGGDDLLVGNAGNDMLFGGQGSDDMRGGQGDDDLDGAEGNDILAGFAGVDFLTGGSGTDIAVFTGNASDYTIISSRGGLFVIDNRSGRPDSLDMLSSIETLRFADGDVAASALPAMSLADPLAQAELSSALAEFGMSLSGLADMMEERLAAREATLAARSGVLRELYGSVVKAASPTLEDAHDFDVESWTLSGSNTNEGFVDLTQYLEAKGSASGAPAFRTVSSLEAFEEGFILDGTVGPVSSLGARGQVALTAVEFASGEARGTFDPMGAQTDLSGLLDQDSTQIDQYLIDDNMFWV